MNALQARDFPVVYGSSKRVAREIQMVASVLFLSLLFFSVSASAKGISPYLPLNMSPEIERQIERMLAAAGDPVLARPIPASRLHNAVKKVCVRQSVLCQQVKSYLRRYMSSDGFAYANLEVNLKSDESASLPNKRGQDSDNAVTGNAQLFRQLSPHWIAALGGERREDGESLEGTYTSIGADWMQIDLGYRPHWYSPFTGSAMLWSTNAETTPSVSVSNSEPLSALNFRYEMFATKLSHSDRIAYQGGTTSGSPCAIGMHLSIAPISNWAFGVNRVMQYGGGERGKCHEPKNLFKAFFDPSSADNAGDNLSKDDEFGNQMASITSRLNVTGAFPWSIYAEYGGEDTSVNKFYRLGNAALQVGLFFPFVTDDLDLTVEYSEWQNAWYVHHIYRDGFVNSGDVIGHWAADQRQAGDGVGGQSSLVQFNWQLRSNHLMHLQFRTVEQASYSAFEYETGNDVSFRYSVGLSDYTVGVQGIAGTNVWGEDFYQAGVFTRW
jgi:Capsule assembly protein Wzi